VIRVSARPAPNPAPRPDPVPPSAPVPNPTPSPAPTPTPEPPDDGLPAPLPPVRASVALRGHTRQQRRRGKALVDRSLRRQRVDHALPGRRLSARLPDAEHGHDDASVQVFGRNRSHDADGVHAPN
jgi:hypothetical protein